MSNQDQAQTINQNFIRTLAEEIREIKESSDVSRKDNDAVKSTMIKQSQFLTTMDSKLDKVTRLVNELPKVEEKRVVIFPEFADRAFYKSFFASMFMWLAILVISIIFMSKAFTLIKGDAHRYKNAWRELYDSAATKKKHEMDSILFYGQRVRLDSIGMKE